MSLQIVRFSAAEGHATAAADGIDRLFAAVHAAAPAGTRYLAARAEDKPDFLLLLQLDEGTANPLLAIPEALDFRAAMAGWAVSPPAPAALAVLGDYRMLS